MNRSIVLIAAAAALGLAACTSTPENSATPSSSSTTTTTTPTATVVTEIVTSTVTAQPPAPAKPVIGSFGYGGLKLGMTRQQAVDAKLLSPPLEGGKPTDACTIHQIIGTDQSVWVSSKMGVSTINFSPEMSSDGVGVGATEAKLKAEYTNLQPTGPNYNYVAQADGNPAAVFMFRAWEGKLTAAFISLKHQDCHD